MEANGVQLRSKLESDARSFAVEFQQALSQHAQQTLAQGVKDLSARTEQAREKLLSESQELQRQFAMSVEPVGTAAIEEHKKRLDNASECLALGP